VWTPPYGPPRSPRPGPRPPRSGRSPQDRFPRRRSVPSPALPSRLPTVGRGAPTIPPIDDRGQKETATTLVVKPWRASSDLNAQTSLNRVSPRSGPGRRNLAHEAAEAPQAQLVPPGSRPGIFYWPRPSPCWISALRRPTLELTSPGALDPGRLRHGVRRPRTAGRRRGPDARG